MEGPGGSLKLLTLKGGGCKRLLWTDYPLIIIVSSGNNILLGRKPLEKKNLMKRFIWSDPDLLCKIN